MDIASLGKEKKFSPHEFSSTKTILREKKIKIKSFNKVLKVDC